MNLTICDDEQYWVDALVEMAFRWSRESGILVKHQAFHRTEELVPFLSSGSQTDLLLLDIEFDKHIEGIELSRYIRSLGFSIPIVFVSGHAIMASEGYFVDAEGFLVKPFSYDQFSFFMRKVCRKNDATQRVLRIETPQKLTLVHHDQITYIEAYGHDLLIHTDNGEYKVRQTLQGMLEELGLEFIRVHREYIVATRRITSIKTTCPYAAELDIGNGKKINISIGRKFFKQIQYTYANNVTRVIM